MKVLMQGNKDLAKRTKIFHCKECGCEFEADKGEYECAGYQYNEAYYKCKCPCCGATALER